MTTSVSGLFEQLKQFSPTDRSDWLDASSEQWSDWTWQLRNRITTLEGLEEKMRLTPDERAGVRLSGSKLALSITPQFFGIMDKNDLACPIRRQVIPNVAETHSASYEL